MKVLRLFLIVSVILVMSAGAVSAQVGGSGSSIGGSGAGGLPPAGGGGSSIGGSSTTQTGYGGVTGNGITGYSGDISLTKPPVVTTYTWTFGGIKVVYTNTAIDWLNGKPMKRISQSDIYINGLLRMSYSQTYVYDGSGKLMSPITYTSRALSYDKNNRVATENIITYSYNTSYRCLSSTRSILTYSYNAAGAVTQYVNNTYHYDGKFKLVLTSTATTKYTYNSNGSIKQEVGTYTERRPDGTIQTYSRTVSDYTYNSNGKLMQKVMNSYGRNAFGSEFLTSTSTETYIYWPGTGAFMLKQIDTRIYDQNKLITKRTITSYRYDQQGNSLGSSLYDYTYTYQDGRIVQTTEYVANFYSNGNTANSSLVSKVLNENGVVVKMDREDKEYNVGNGTLGWKMNVAESYNAYGSLIGKSVDQNWYDANGVLLRSSHEYTTNTYENGLLKQKAVEYSEYDASGNRCAYYNYKEIYDQSGVLSERYSYYASGRAASHDIYQAGSLWVSDHYYDDQDNRLMAEIWGNGQYTHYTNETIATWNGHVVGKQDVFFNPSDPINGVTAYKYNLTTNQTYLYRTADVSDINNPILIDWKGVRNPSDVVEGQIHVTGDLTMDQAAYDRFNKYDMDTTGILSVGTDTYGYNIYVNGDLTIDTAGTLNLEGINLYVTGSITINAGVITNNEQVHIIGGTTQPPTANSGTIQMTTSITTQPLLAYGGVGGIIGSSYVISSISGAAQATSAQNLADFGAKSVVTARPITNTGGIISFVGTLVPTAKTPIPIPVKGPEVKPAG